MLINGKIQTFVKLNTAFLQYKQTREHLLRVWLTISRLIKTKIQYVKRW